MVSYDKKMFIFKFYEGLLSYLIKCNFYPNVYFKWGHSIYTKVNFKKSLFENQ